MGVVAIAVLVIMALLVFYVISIYNKLVSLRNRFKNSFAQIDVQLKRRYDLIPNIVETAKAYLKHERETLEAVIKARNNASQIESQVASNPENPQTMKALLGAESVLSGTLGRLFALSERYPDLKADTNMRQVSEELTSTENKISFARQAFNDSVMHYNNAREQFPNSVIAGMFQFLPAVSFEITNPEEREPVRVKF